MKYLYSCILATLFTFLTYLLYLPILINDYYFISNYPFYNIIIFSNNLWFIIKLLFIIITFIFYLFITLNYITKNIHISNKITNKSNDNNSYIYNKLNHSISLFIGNKADNSEIIIPEKSLYQNILITGSIGSGKTASAMYPFTKQLIQYSFDNNSQKIGFLILDVKGNYYNKVLEFAKECNRENDVIVIELNGKYKYNPLDKPNLKATILANRLKEILTLFSPNNSEDFWLDKASQIIENTITFIRLYNDNFVNFIELHKIITDYSYFSLQAKNIRNKFISGIFNHKDSYNLFNSINFLENEFYKLDDRTLGILKSEITRITNCFTADYEVKNTFCPTKENENFNGFTDVINNGKIVVLNMNIAEYKNLSKIIAAYLKLDFQNEVMHTISCNRRSLCFISDEYQEYVTASDADFYAQAREAKCINIVATQSYTSLLNSIKNEHSTKVIIQNLINKLWYRTDDVFTIEEIQKQIGKEDKKKLSTTISENSKENNFNYLLNRFTSNKSNISESINSYFQNDYIYDYNEFTQKLNTFECIAFLSNGTNIIQPQKIYMKPYFKN